MNMYCRREQLRCSRLQSPEKEQKIAASMLAPPTGGFGELY